MIETIALIAAGLWIMQRQEPAQQLLAAQQQQLLAAQQQATAQQQAQIAAQQHVVQRQEAALQIATQQLEAAQQQVAQQQAAQQQAVQQQPAQRQSTRQQSAQQQSAQRQSAQLQALQQQAAELLVDQQVAENYQILAALLPGSRAATPHRLRSTNMPLCTFSGCPNNRIIGRDARGNFYRVCSAHVHGPSMHLRDPNRQLCANPSCNRIVCGGSIFCSATQCGNRSATGDGIIIELQPNLRQRSVSRASIRTPREPFSQLAMMGIPDPYPSRNQMRDPPRIGMPASAIGVLTPMRGMEF